MKVAEDIKLCEEDYVNVMEIQCWFTEFSGRNIFITLYSLFITNFGLLFVII